MQMPCKPTRSREISETHFLSHGTEIRFSKDICNDSKKPKLVTKTVCPVRRRHPRLNRASERGNHAQVNFNGRRSDDSDRESESVSTFDPGQTYPIEISAGTRIYKWPNLGMVSS